MKISDRVAHRLLVRASSGVGSRKDEPPVADRTSAGNIDVERESPASARRGTPRLSGSVLSAGAIGNILEWYDFGLYGLFAPILAELFFPATHRFAALLGAYSGFAVGFLMRPLGGAVLGHFGDKVGRRFVLIWSIVLMGLTTAAIGFLPTFKTIGVAAPLLLLALRIVQGFSVGGEFTGSVAYLVENAPQDRRGLAGSIANIGSTAGMLLAAALAAAASTFFDSADLKRFGWRLPFLFGGAIAALGYFLRHRLKDGPPRELGTKSQSLPLKRALKEAPQTMLWATLFTSGYGIVNYLTMVFLPTFASEFGSIAESHALQLNSLAQAFALAVVPFSGWLGDRAVRRRSLLIVVFLVEAAGGFFWFRLAHEGGFAGFAAAQIIFGVLLALLMGTAPAMLAEQFKADYRLSGYSVSFNIGIGVAGGTAPIIATALIAVTGNPLAPAFDLMFAAAIASGAAFMLSDGSRQQMR